MVGRAKFLLQAKSGARIPIGFVVRGVPLGEVELPSGEPQLGLKSSGLSPCTKPSLPHFDFRTGVTSFRLSVRSSFGTTYRSRGVWWAPSGSFRDELSRLRE